MSATQQPDWEKFGKEMYKLMKAWYPNSVGYADCVDAAIECGILTDFIDARNRLSREDDDEIVDDAPDDCIKHRVAAMVKRMLARG